MHTEIANKVSTLLENHNELKTLIDSDQFSHFDEETQLALIKLHEEVDAVMNSINAQVDALDLKIADLLGTLRL